MIELAIILGVVAASAIVAIYWTKILNWAQKSLMPWVDKNLPELSDAVRTAFVIADKAMSPARAAVKAAWQRVRTYLLKQIAEFEQVSNNSWMLRISSWVRVRLDAMDPAPAVKLIQTEQLISFDELPPEIREQLLRKGETTQRVDVTRAQDNELDLVMGT